MLALVPVYRYWPSSNPTEGTHTLLNFADGAPALLERTFKGPKTGRVLLWTTPLSRRPDRGGALQADPDAWNEFPLPVRLVVPGSDVPDGPLPGRRVQRSSSTSRPARTCS